MATAVEPAEAASAGPTADPTLPSWAPRSCSGYHAAVVQALACDEIARSTREAIRRTYDDKNHSWQNLEDASQATLDDIGRQCTDDAAQVRAARAGKCATTAER